MGVTGFDGMDKVQTARRGWTKGHVKNRPQVNWRLQQRPRSRCLSSDRVNFSGFIVARDSAGIDGGQLGKTGKDGGKPLAAQALFS